MSRRRRALLLAVARTDTTWDLVAWRGARVWEGRCLHCGRALRMDVDGNPISEVTVDHILPRHHGGTDDLLNLGLACARCNHGKGARHDHRRADDARLHEIVGRLLQARRARWRDPDDAPG